MALSIPVSSEPSISPLPSTILSTSLSKLLENEAQFLINFQSPNKTEKEEDTFSDTSVSSATSDFYYQANEQTQSHPPLRSPHNLTIVIPPPKKNRKSSSVSSRLDLNSGESVEDVENKKQKEKTKLMKLMEDKKKQYVCPSFCFVIGATLCPPIALLLHFWIHEEHYVSDDEVDFGHGILKSLMVWKWIFVSLLLTVMFWIPGVIFVIIFSSLKLGGSAHRNTPRKKVLRPASQV